MMTLYAEYAVTARVADLIDMCAIDLGCTRTEPRVRPSDMLK